MSHSFLLFCPNCCSYFPSGLVCRRCGYRRTRLQMPSPPGEPVWRVQVPGSVAGQIALADLDGQLALVLSWSHLPRRGDGRPPDGGVNLFQVVDGQPLWSRQFYMPVEGGVAVGEGLLVAGIGVRSIGAGTGWLVALDLKTGEERWRSQLGGAVRSAPVIERVRVYAAACDGALYCLDLRDGQQVWRAPVYAGEAQIPASPLIVRERGMFKSVVVGTYGGAQGRAEGKLIALDERGRKLWEQSAGGNVRATPILDSETIYVTAFRSSPSAGLISAFDASNGRPRWPEPFKIQGQPSDRGAYNFSASPLVHGQRVFVGSLNRRMFALDSTTGRLLWESEVGGGIASAPTWVEGLVVFGANDGNLYALEADSGKEAWRFSLEAPVLTGPLASEGLLFAGADNGQAVALPWHLGQYDWAAERLERGGRFLEAGDLRALAAHFNPLPQLQRRSYQLAAEDWVKAGEPERAAYLWLGLDERELAADTYKAAGFRWRMHDCQRAAGYFKQAADLYARLRKRDELNECTRALATCAELPYILMQAANVGSFIQWEQGELTLRLLNEGAAPALGGVRLWLGGTLKTAVEAQVRSDFSPGQTWNIPLGVVPTRGESLLEVDVEYDTGVQEFTPLRGMLTIPIEAVEPRQNIVVGDVGMLQLTIASTTLEGLAVVTRDVGLVRTGGDIGSLKTSGDVGAISAAGDIGEIHTDGDIGLVRGGRKNQ